MDLETDTKLLKLVADGGQMDYALWPELLPKVIQRLEHIAHNEFPIPKLQYLQASQAESSSLIQTQPDPVDVSQTTGDASSQATDKENAPPPTQSSTSTTANNAVVPSGTLPSQILDLLTSITSTLTSYFTSYPPHTIQRLSELVLTPRRHYRTLPAYLHAVDRVVHVTSGANIYPLPAAVPDASGVKILSNGTTFAAGHDPSSVSWGTSTSIQNSLGSDESLGGALLTPISWLRNPSQMNNSGGNGTVSELEGEVKTESTETIDGPNGAGSIETVSVSVNGISSITLSSSPAPETGGLRAEGGVTQGELLRQEQRAGVVPAAQLSSSRGSIDGDGEEDEVPHVRGPDEIGMEDMGPQAAGTIVTNGPLHGMHGIDVEAAVGRRAEGIEGDADEMEDAPATPKREADGELGGEIKRVKDENGDPGIEIVDADRKTDDDEKMGETADVDAVDTTAV